MQKLEELMQKLCPNGVEYRPLGELCEIRKGKQLNKDGLLEQGNYPVINGGINPSGYWNEYNFEKDLITISQGGASAGYVNFITTKFWAGAHCYVLVNPKNCLNYRLLYHIIKNYEKELMSSQVGAGIPSVSSNKLASLQIPIPPIEVQREIVRILDNFTKLTAELTAELTARQKQYEYYRNELLNVESRIKNVELKRLGDVCNIGDGLHGTPEYDENGEVYFINGNNVKGGKIQFDNNTKKINNMEYQKLRLPFDNNTLFLSINGTIGNVAIYRNERIALGKSVAYFNIITDKLNRKYLFYILQSAKAQIYFKNSVTGGTIKNLGLKALREFQIQIPPLEEQKRIVAILDHFDKLCNDISEGLPAEIEARQKQYEYYRDKLLTFEEIAQ